jgi:hypothetical protein
MSDREPNIEKRGIIVFVINEDFTKKDYDKWKAQVALWISRTQKSKLEATKDDPVSKADKVLQAAINGTKLNGEIWGGVEAFTLRSRIKQLCGFDIKTGTGRTYKKAHQRSTSHPINKDVRDERRLNREITLDIEYEEQLEARENYKDLLYQEFPHTDNPIYESQVNALAEAVVKLEHISKDYLVSKGKTLEDHIKVRAGIINDIDAFMKQLRIHPSQLKEKTDTVDEGNVGALIDHLDDYGEVAEIYEKVDAIQEAIQTVRQLEQLRVDGSPQLADWLLWHKTGMKPFEFKCRCGSEYTLYDGFTIEEMYEICEQAYNAFGFGLKRINEDSATTEA